MERHREARRGSMAAATANGGGGGGGGLSRRRQRNSSGFRDSPEEDGRMEMPETSRLRDRGAKKDRDRDRSSRSKRRRGERTLHGSNRDRDEADESSEESIEQDEDDEDEDLSVPVRLPPSSPPLVNQAAASSPQHNHQLNHHHQQQLPRKSFPPKVVKWKPDEMIGFTVPRKARSATSKRSHETSGIGGAGGGGGGGDQITRQASISPSRLSPASTTQLSPSSSNGSLRKKMKQVSGAKIRPPKISKSTSLSHDEIEMEVAEVLYGMTRQFECLPKHDGHKVDSRDVDGGSGNEAKSRVPSTNSLSPSPAAYPSALPSSNSCSNPAPFAAIAPKRKKPRPVKFDEESPTSPVGVQHLSSLSVPSVAKIDSENQIKAEASSPRSEKNSASAAIKNGGESVDVLVSQAVLSDVQQQQESTKTKKGKTQELHTSTGGSNNGDKVESKEELVPRAIGSACGGLDVNICDTAARKMAPDSPKEEMFKIDLMAPPPGKLSPERGDFNDFDADHKSLGPDNETALKLNKDKTEEKPAESTVTRDEQQTEKYVQREIDSRKQVVIKQTLDLQLDLEKPKKDDSGIDKVQVQKQQAKDPKVEPKQEKSGSAPSLQMPLTVGTWPGGFPPYGYMSQVPSLHAVVPMDGSAGPSSSLQPPAFLQTHPRPKRCATHCYIAQMISNHQKFARMNCFWTAAAGAAPLYGTKPYNPNIVPPSDASTPGNPTQGSFLGANMGTLQEAKGTPALASYMGSTSQEKMLSSSNTIMESAQRKPLIFQQVPHSATANNMLHGPAFIFPINQQQATAAAANRAGAAKSTPGSGAEVRASGAMSSAVGSCGGGGTANPVNLSFASLPPNEAQYVAFLQNNMYPFPAHISGATAFRGTSNAQAMPFFYPPHMLHPSQLRPQQQQPAAGPLPHVQPNPGNLSGSSQKHPQQLYGIKGSVSVANANGCPATNHRQDHVPQHSRPMECKGMEDDLPTTDAAIAMGNGGGHGDKQPAYQQKQNMKVELTPPQAFTIPFASFGGAGTATPGLDFSSMVQNHAILQSLPENSRHGYHQMPTAAVAATTQAAEQKKVHQVSEDVKSVARELNTNMLGEEDRKIMVASKGPQHSFSFEKADNEPPISSVLSNSGVDISARSINLIQTSANGSRSTDRASGTATATTAATIVATSQQPQHHLIHLQKQQLQMQHQLASTRSKPSASSNNANMHPESLPGGSTVTKFPHALTGFPQAFVQGGSPIQWPQGKTSSGRLVDPAAAAAPPLVKNNVLQLQGRASQQPFPAQSHQTQISFGVNSNKMVAPGSQHLSGVCSSPSPSSAAVAVGSPSNSVNKNASGSPSASASVKPCPQTSAILLPQQSAVKQSASSSSSKSTTASNSNMPSILGHPQKVPAPSSNTKQQQQPQQSKQQPFSEAQIFFSNPHLQQVQCAQSSAATTAAQYYQKRQSEQQTRQSQQQQQQSSAPSSAGMLSLCAPSALTLAGVPTTSDPAKAMAAASVAVANNIKGMPPPGYYNAAQLAVAAQSASGSPRPPISATFPYMSLPPFTMKPSSEQKPAAGSDNLHACWQPEKR
ncbi:Protein TIME FOR [Musa troglodytarum]|uniref:Protein TIME FOR n=1 Tax=Musa troglodytarum TaxID=320322 RepID=A0A9E7JW73_9LILI|nr:Protein TIME FOR [Musa troglodytarum]URD94635.1 Protein TIME FOR [Musa troglodytarum]URD94636.1 Protein TIME FOR [Musa troglodytarum]